MSVTLTIESARAIIAQATRHGVENEAKPLARTMLVASKLSPAQKFILIEHACGPRPVLVREISSINVLASMRLLRFTYKGGTETARPSNSYATDLGREVAAYLLAELADTLIAASETPE